MKRTTKLIHNRIPLIAALGLAVSGLMLSTPALAGPGNNIQYYLNGNNGNATFAHGVNPTAHGHASPNGLAHAACVSAVANCIAPPPPGGGGGGGNPGGGGGGNPGGGGGNPGGGGGNPGGGNPPPVVVTPPGTPAPRTLPGGGNSGPATSLAALNGFCVTDDSFCKDNNLRRVIARDSVIDEVFELTQL